MSAAGRFGRSMALAAMASAVAVAKKHALVAAVAARSGLHLGQFAAWAGMSVALGLVLYFLSSLVTRGRGETPRSRTSGFYPATARSGRRAGRR